ncbi:MAG: hypothetical protein ACD_23C00109G0002 [uncultured bacterium]|nr:MAG: hypothetical protein ACD_23C00109G0002 [uncultured bacterium]
MQNTTRRNGFSLVELTIVLVIVALLSSGLMFGLSAQNNTATNRDAQNQLNNAKEVLFGFVITNGRLPCPADPALTTQTNSAGTEILTLTPPNCDPKASGCVTACKLEHGVLPWQTLAIQEVDPWGNRLTYFVGREFSNPISYDEEISGIKARFSLDTVGRANIQSDTGQPLASEVPAVIVSHGSRAFGAYTTAGLKITGATGDELENSKGTQTFISRPLSDNFDDYVVWIVPSILKSRLVAVGKLP